MQFTKNGIPVNVPQRFNPRIKAQVIKQRVQKEKSYNHFAELSRTVNGLEQTIITPIAITEYKKALAQGFREISRWTYKKPANHGND